MFKKFTSILMISSLVAYNYVSVYGGHKFI